MIGIKSELDLFPINGLIEHYDAAHIQRLFVVGDLHGCYHELMQKLNIIGFDFSNDLLVSVGDLVDRGKYSVKCLELIKKPWFIAIRGNHEQMCLEAVLAPEMQQFHCKHGGDWLYELSQQKQQECLKLCLSLPIVLEINFKGKKYGFIHADINVNDWHHFKEFIQLNDYFTNQGSSIVQSALWGRSRILYGNKSPLFRTVAGIDEIYLGHTVVEHTLQIQNCFYVDTGVVFGKKLTVKELL